MHLVSLEFRSTIHYCFRPPLRDRMVVLKKATRAMRAMRGNALETVLFQLCFGYAESFLRVLSDKYLQATRAMRAKQAVTLPLQSCFGFHCSFQRLGMTRERTPRQETDAVTMTFTRPQMHLVGHSIDWPTRYKTCVAPHLCSHEKREASIAAKVQRHALLECCSYTVPCHATLGQ